MKVINKILYSEIKNNIWPLFSIVVFMFLIVGFDAISPWPFKILIDNVLSANPLDIEIKSNFLQQIFNSRYLLGFFTVFIYFISTFSLTIIEYLKASQTKKVIKNLTADFSKSAFKNMESLAIGFYKKQQIGDYIYRLGYDVSALGELLEDGILPLITSGLYLTITLTVMFFIDVKLTLLSLVVLPFLALGLHSFNSSVSYATKKSEYFNSVVFSFIEEALTHLKIIQAFSQERRESGIFNKKTETSLKSDVALYRLNFLLSLLVGVIIALSYSIIILYGIRSVFAGTLTTGLLIVFIFYLDNLTNPILSIIYAITATKQSYVKISRMNEFFTKKTHLEYEGAVKEMKKTSIKFKKVNLVGDKGKKILDNVSFEIEENKRTVIFGVNGSGKTSVVNLIMRFVDKPSSGSIFIGDDNILDYDLKVLRDNIAFVPQEITLFNDTIKNNISFGNYGGKLSEVKKAAQLAGASDFIKRLPDNYEFNVGSAGNFLSGGQRQRLMLARAFMKKDAKILLFDETFSALDVKTRKDVLENIYNFSAGKTTIIVSNIFDVVSAADNVIVLNKGKVIYSGKSSRLPKEISLYKMIIDND